MAWVSISNTAIDQDSPITVSLMTALRDNPAAIANGDAGAPRIQNAALATNSVTSVKIASGAVTNSEIAVGAVQQSSISTSIGEVSQTSQFGVGSLLALPGGSYGFYPQLRITFGSVNAVISSASSTYTTGIRFLYSFSHTHDGGNAPADWSDTTADGYAQQRYINSSPPYNIGDGDVPLFVYALVGGDGQIKSTYAADVPPWAYNGPTSVTAHRQCKVTGRKFQIVKSFNRESGELEFFEREVCDAVKNADMVLIPHPFCDINNDDRVILLEPCATEKLLLMQQAGDSIGELLRSRYLRLGNDIKCRSPSGVQPVSFKFANNT